MTTFVILLPEQLTLAHELPETATPRRLKPAGLLRLESNHVALHAIGEHMLARGEA